MNARFFFPIHLDSLVLMENTSLGFVTEGHTARERAIEAYMKAKATPKDHEALELLRRMEAPDADLDTVRDCRLDFGEMVDEEDFATEVPLKPEDSPLAVYGMALWWLNPVQGKFLPQNAAPLAQTALEAGFDPARGLLADCLLREWLERTDLFRDDDKPGHAHESEKKAFDKLGCLEKALEGDVNNPALEDALLVAGQRLGRTGRLPGLEELQEQDRDRMEALVRQGLKTLAERGHVDALRMLALARSENEQTAPEIAWAREELVAKANRGEPGWKLVLAQRLAGLLPTWPAKGDMADNLAKARALFEDVANEGEPRAATTLAWLLLGMEGGNDGKAPDRNAVSRAEGLLLDVIEKTGFAPAKALLGAHIFNTQKDWDRAWPLLRDACKDGFSEACEAACADFLYQMVQNARFVERVERGEDFSDGDFDIDPHGGFDLWLGRFHELGVCSRFGEVYRATVRAQLSWGVDYLKDTIYPDGPNSQGCSPDQLLYRAATRYRGHCAVHALALTMGKEDRLFSNVTLENLKRAVADGAAQGMAACVAALPFLIRRWPENGADKPFRSWTLEQLRPLCEELAPATNLARTAASFMGLAELFERQAKEKDTSHKTDTQRMERDTARLKVEYDRASANNDTPVFCVLAVLFKKAAEDLSPEAACALLDHVNMAVFGDDEESTLREPLNWMDACVRQKGLSSWRILDGLGLDPEADFDGSAQEREEQHRETLRAFFDLIEQKPRAVERHPISSDRATVVKASRKARRKRERRERNAKRKR